MAFTPGQKVGDYEVLAKLGAGGLGVVYEVQHQISRRREAMKILLPDQGSPEMVERFRREVQTLATLNHVNIAQLHTAFYYENQLAMVMELVHGETLRDLRLRISINLPQALDYIEQTLKALAYAHKLGVVHRDIKPSNIMITDGGFVKLLDFGIALAGPSELTRAGFLLGSLNYMSPEQVNGQRATPRSDLYSVGVTLYELLTGTLPIKGANNYEIMMAHLNQAPVPPHRISSQVPGKVSDAIMRALAKDPAQRFANADEFLHALRLTPMASMEEGNTYAGPLPASVRSALAAAGSARNPAPAASTPRPETAAAVKTPPPGAVPLPAAQSSPVPRTPPPMPAYSEPSQPAPAQATPPAIPLQPPAQPGPGKSGSSTGFPNLAVEDISRKLAFYIGPFAKLVIKKLAAQSEDLDFIYREAAKEIPSDADRAAFLRARRQ
jgi:serine/threonine-protein kinase